MPNQSIDLNSYDPDISKIQRQQRLADMLQQQTMDAVPINSYNGVQAPISPFSVLAKALQGYAAKKNQDKADQGAEDYRNRDMAASQALLRQLTQQTPGIPSTPTTVDGTMPSLPGQAPQPQGPQAPLQVGGAAPAPALSPQEQMAAILGARGGPQTQMIQQSMLPQIMNRQNLDYQHQLGREDKTWEAQQPLSVADQQRSALQLKNQEAAAQFTNQLPQTANERATNALGYAQLNKPQFVPYGTTGYMQGNQFHEIAGGAGGASPFGLGDPKSPSINGQTGLSSMGYNYLTGNTSQMGMRDKAMASKEVDQFISRTGLDASTVKPQVQAFQSAVNMNTLKANTMDTLAREVTGTVQNYGPVIDKLTGGGNLRLGNRGFELVGSALNDPTAQKAVFYLNQMRADMAGFNAASGGKIGMHGQTQTDNADFAKADEVIKNGLSSGGARALAEAVEATREKNVGVAKQQVIEAQRGIWNALGIGKNFDAAHPEARSANPAPANGSKVPPPPPGFVVHP